MKRSNTTLAAAVLLTTCCLTFARDRDQSARPPEPWFGPQGAFVFVEAEAFDLAGSGWTIDEKSGKRGFPPASGLKALQGRARDAGVAVKSIDVPADGAFRLWVRYAQLERKGPNDRGPFDVIVEQAGLTVARYTLDDAYDGPVKPRVHAVPPFTWDARDINLRRGPATISLDKPQGAINPYLRKVDCVLLTADADYAADHRDFGPQTYMRIGLEDAAPPLYFTAMFNHMRPPIYNSAAIGRTSWVKPMNRSPDDDNRLDVGGKTAWLNISPLLDTDLDTIIKLAATVKYTADEQVYADRSAYSVDFATAPRDDAIVRTVRRDGVGYGLHVRVGPLAHPDVLPRTDLEIAAETRAMVEALTPVTFGRRPTLFPLMTDWSADDNTHTPGARACELAVMQWLGLSAKVGPPLDQTDLDAGILFTREHCNVWFRGPGGFDEPLVDRMRKQIERRADAWRAASFPERSLLVKVMDEAGGTPLARLAATAANQQAFVAYCREHYDSSQALGVASWSDLRLPRDAQGAPPAVYRAAQRYRVESVASFFKTATNLVHDIYGPGMKTAQNFSDGAVYTANLYSQGNDYYVWFRSRALDVAMSEDWSALGSTPQCGGWNVALLRSAVKYHHQPISMYVISYGPPFDTKLRAYCDIAQGAKSLNFYAYGPLYQGHEPGWCRKPATFSAIAEITREVGAAEHVLIDAMPRRADVAIIYSVNADLWTDRRDNTMGFERMHTYLAMRHGQVAVDVLSEDDVIEGRLADYKVAYLFGDQFDRGACAPLAEWVAAGGALVLGAGAAQRDQLNQPMSDLDAALHLTRRAVVQPKNHWGSGRFLHKRLGAVGSVRLGATGASVDALGRRQDFVPAPGATVLATFDDGAPAAVSQRAGDGRVVMHGFTPALTYICGALRAFDELADEPVRDVADAVESMQDETEAMARQAYSMAPRDFDGDVRAFILKPALDAAPDQPVSADRALVEATLLQGERGWVVTLANITGQPLDRVTVTVRAGPRPSGGVRSSRCGALDDADTRRDVATVTLPLATTDMLFAEWED